MAGRFNETLNDALITWSIKLNSCKPRFHDKKKKSKYLDVDKMFSFVNERTVSRMDTLFNLACTGRPLTDTSYNLKIGLISAKC